VKLTRKTISILLWIGAFLLVISAGGGWLTIKVVAPKHTKKVTGRDDVPAHSCFYCHRPV